MSEQIEWEGYVERITFRNEENGYTVLFLVDAEEEEEVCRGAVFESDRQRSDT